MRTLYKLDNLGKDYIDAAKQSRQNLEHAFEADNEDPTMNVDLGWAVDNAEERG
jgi:hypothetical protein